MKSRPPITLTPGTFTLDIIGAGDYLWEVKGPASIKVINEYGETLGIYVDAILIGTLGDKQTETIKNVGYGEHILTALKASDSTEAAKTTINVTENKEYSWTITK